MEFARDESPHYLRFLLIWCSRNDMAVNGGGQPRTIRSFGDSGRDKRSRVYLSRIGGNSRLDDDLLNNLKDWLHGHHMRPLIGWESLYEVPEEAVVILSNNLTYLQNRDVQDIIEQGVVVARNRVVILLKAQKGAAKLQDKLLEWNHNNPQDPVRKICSHDGRLLFNLQKTRVTTFQWSRPRDMPAALPHDLDCTLEGADMDRLENLFDTFLQGVMLHMRANNFLQTPINFVVPTVYYLKDRVGKVTRPRFFLSWKEEAHAILFYLLWNNYHWSSGDGAEVYILRTRNPKCDRIGDKASTRYILQEPSTIGVHGFVEFLRYWQVAITAGGQQQALPPKEAQPQGRE